MKHILVIEDEEAIRETIVDLLEFGGYQVSEAANGQAGLEACYGNPPDLILCDINMPVMNGYQLLAKLSQNPRTEKIPFIFLTAQTQSEQIHTMHGRADDYISKPFTMEVLMDAVETNLKKGDRANHEPDTDQA